MSSLHYQALSGRTRRRRSSPLVSAAALMAIAALLALVQSVRAEELAIGCAGTFARDTTRAQLVAAFGAANVIDQVAPGPEGHPPDVTTIVFPRDPGRRLEVRWHDPVARARPFASIFTRPSRWEAPLGVRVGMSIDALERLNGKPFSIGGFEGLIDGMSWFDGGALDHIAGGCTVGVTMAPNVKLPRAKMNRIQDDDQHPSTDPIMRAAKPTVWQVQVVYQAVAAATAK